MSHVDWPAVDPGVVAHLQKLFQTPLCLEASFDNETQCEELIVEGFLTSLMNLSWMSWHR